jgi:hypothetical protein
MVLSIEQVTPSPKYFSPDRGESCRHLVVPERRITGDDATPQWRRMEFW